MQPLDGVAETGPLAVLATSLDEAVGAPLETVAPSLTDSLTDLESDPADDETAAVTDDVLTEQRRRQQQVTVLNRVRRHDLRNDAVVVESYAGPLADDPGNEAYVDGAARRAAEMRELVETVRAVERHLDAGEPRLSTVDVTRVARERVAVITLRFRTPEGERYHGRDEETEPLDGAETEEAGAAGVYRDDDCSRGPGEPSPSTERAGSF